MRLKTLGVFTMIALALFTVFYWVTDDARRDAVFQEQQAELVELGKEYFGPDNINHDVNITDAGFDPAAVTIEVNASVQFVNKIDRDVVVRGVGAHPFELAVMAGSSAASRFQVEGTTDVTGDGISGSLVVTSGPEALNPAAANCARCHGPTGHGGPVGDTGVMAPNLHSRSLAEKWQATGGAVAKEGQPALLNNYVNKVIRFGGVVVSGNVKSLMPAWSTEAGGVLTVQQIDALTALIGTWADETLQQPVAEVPNTVEAGQQVFSDAGCASCHAADLSGAVGPNLQNIGNEPVTDQLPTPVSQLDKLKSDYADDPRNFLELWIRDSATNYNDGQGTGMPAHPESSLSDSELKALITFLLSQKQ
jgi:mono/diheme cytochrome c family protein